MRLKLQSCSCGNKRFAPIGIDEFFCEVCIFKTKHPLEGLANKIKNVGYVAPKITYHDERVYITNGKEPKKYSDYIESGEWQEKRLEAFAKRGRKCEACNEDRGLHVHHADYGNLGNESMADLRILCKSCHFELHELYDKKKKGRARWPSLLKHSKKFISRKRRFLKKQLERFLACA